MDRIDPAEHDKLYQRIIENGAVISEFPMGTRPLAFNFPPAIDSISGLSLGVVVVEANGEKRLFDYGSVGSRAGTGSLCRTRRGRRES